MITFGSLFSGIGGIDLGFERAGMVCRWQVEIDPYCQAVLDRHWPHVPLYSDIKEITGHVLQPVDVITAGFPCQPVSLAGKGKAQADERWLWGDVARIVGALAPIYVVVENVPGLLQRGLAQVLGSLADLGFDAHWTCLSAAAFGAPHLRDRVFVVAHANSVNLRDKSQQPRWQGASVTFDNGTAQHVADTDKLRWQWWPRPFGQTGRQEPAHCGGTWATEPDVGRVAYGVPARVDRLRALGNAVVPQVAQYVGRQIIAHAQRNGLQ